MVLFRWGSKDCSRKIKSKDYVVVQIHLEYSEDYIQSKTIFHLTSSPQDAAILLDMKLDKAQPDSISEIGGISGEDPCQLVCVILILSSECSVPLS